MKRKRCKNLVGRTAGVRCELPSNHRGPHRHSTTVWTNTAERASADPK